jgi:hypothetical protein
VKAVNFEPLLYTNSTAAVVPPGMSSNGAVHYNKTNFTGAPRVIVAMKSYGMLPVSSFTGLNAGFRFNITGKNNTNFTYTVTTFGVTVVALHYQYFAVLGYDNLYYMQFYTLTRNPAATQPTPPRP